MSLISPRFVPPVIAHRGASMYAPENTFAAFTKAHELGIHWVEFDVMLSKDDEAVIIHDETLERTTSGKGLVGERLYSELKDLDAGTWFQADYAAERIPTLQLMMELLKKLGLSANIEIKPQLGREEATVKKVLATLEKSEPHDLFPPLISSFSFETLQWVQKLAPNSMIGFLMHEWQADWRVKCDELQAVTVNINDKILSEKRVQEVKNTDRQVLVYTVNNAERAQTLFNWGVSAVFSDCPDRILSKR
jgi:glycerophosphoryl diester phosphodiesterase